MGISNEAAPNDETDVPKGMNCNVARNAAVRPGARSWTGMPRKATRSNAAVPASVWGGTNGDE